MWWFKGTLEENVRVSGRKTVWFYLQSERRAVCLWMSDRCFTAAGLSWSCIISMLMLCTFLPVVASLQCSVSASVWMNASSRRRPLLLAVRLCSAVVSLSSLISDQVSLQNKNKPAGKHRKINKLLQWPGDSSRTGRLQNCNWWLFDQIIDCFFPLWSLLTKDFQHLIKAKQ